jgi:hypothetical protein
MKLLAGLTFQALGNGHFRIELARRADLAAGRLARQRGSAAARLEIGGVIDCTTMEFARRLQSSLERKFAINGTFPAERMESAMEACRRHGLTIHTLRDKPSSKGPRVSEKRVVVRKTIEDPLLRGAEKAHRVDLYQQNPRGRAPGYVGADVNLDLLIGGLARIKRISEAQREGARDFRSAAEHAQLGAAKALDYERPLVDTSGPSADLVEEIGADARANYQRARQMLGIGSLELAVAEGVIVQGETVSDCAKRLGIGTSGHARRTVTRAARSASAMLARHYGYDKTSNRKRVVVEGEMPTTFTQEEDGSRVILGRP